MPDLDPWPTIDADDLVWLDTDEMIEVDRVMIDELGIELIQMMENAGRNLATLVLGLHPGEAVVVYCGGGGNGGGGLVAARHLANRGVAVRVVLDRPAESYVGVPRHQLEIVQRMGVAIDGQTDPAAVAVDAIIGYSLRGAPRGRAADLIEAANGHRRCVALDIPSGVDGSSGATPGAHVQADATLTLAMPKQGLATATATATATVGRLFVGDISVPSAVYAAFGRPIEHSPFAAGPIVEVVESGG